MSRENSRKLRLQQKKFMEELIDETEQAVARMLFKMTNDRTLVDDVMIATWTTACQKIDVLEKHENPHGWIMRAAKFHMLRELEKRRHIHSHEMLILEELEVYIEQETQNELELSEALKPYLNEDERRAVILRYFYEVSYSDLADYFHISESNARKRVSRAIGKLRRAAPDLWHECGNEGI